MLLITRSLVHFPGGDLLGGVSCMMTIRPWQLCLCYTVRVNVVVKPCILDLSRSTTDQQKITNLAYGPNLPILLGVSQILKFSPNALNPKLIFWIFKMLMEFFLFSPIFLLFHVGFFQKLQEKLLAVRN